MGQSQISVEKECKGIKEWKAWTMIEVNEKEEGGYESVHMFTKTWILGKFQWNFMNLFA